MLMLFHLDTRTLLQATMQRNHFEVSLYLAS
jgi:hypothetical protein